MLNQLFSKIEALFKNANATGVQHLQTVFAPLAEINENLPSDILSFILSGQNPEILLQLNHLPDEKASALVDTPGTYKWYWTHVDISKSQEKLLKASIKARQLLNDDLFEYLNHEQIIRLGKIYEAVTQQKNYLRLYDAVPTWFSYIVVDGLVSIFKHHGFSEIDRKRDVKKNWTLAKLEALLGSDEAELAQHFPAFIFERQDSDSYYTDQLDLIFDLPDSDAYIEQHLAQLQKIIPDLSVNGQNVFLSYISKKPDLIKQIPELVVRLSIGRLKTIREIAVTLLSHLNPEDSQKYLAEYLVNGQSKERTFAAELLARLGQQNLETLKHAHANEKQKAVQQSILMAIQRLETVVSSETPADLIIPEFAPLVTTPIPRTFSEEILENYQQVLKKAEQSAESEIQDNKSSDYKSRWAQDNLRRLQKVKEAMLMTVVPQLNGEQARRHFDSDEHIITYQRKLQNLPEFSIVHALRVIFNHNNREHIYWGSLFDLLKPEQYSELDLRQLVQALTEVGYHHPKRLIAKGFLSGSWYSLESYIQDPEKIWPFFAENLDYLSEAFGILPSQEERSYQDFTPASAISILSHFPIVPQQYIPRLLELALGENKRLRFDAQQTLQRVPNIHLRAIEALNSSKQEIRITAIEWLSRLQHQDAVKPLNALLKKEKKEIVRAALLTALEKLGVDIHAHLSEKVLLKEAEQGLKAKLSTSFTWFDAKTLPEMKWQSGKKVNPAIIHWWVILAEKLRDPKANALFQRYISLLDAKSQQTLSNHLFYEFIHRDTRGPTLDEASEMAAKEAPGRLVNYQDWYKRYPEYYTEYANVTLEQVTEELKKSHLATYLGSAIKSKGMLALTFAAQGSFAVKLLQDYMKQHYTRRAQIEAMISALAVNNDPLVIQLLLSLSRRYRTASVQTMATQLVAEIAERNQWTSDELADRTIPTAGLDEKGILNLEYGSRQFSAFVDDKDKFVLKNEEGKVIKSLPTARQTDDPALIKEAKSLFSNSKKELKQVIDLQTQRLYEAMCSERQWNSNEWLEYLHAHPIVCRLIQRLVWLETTASGEKIAFRPSDDGSLLNLDDDEIELQADSKIQVAHAVLVGEDTANAWIDHFKDYKVKFLFSQMEHHLPDLEQKAELIEDRKGWLTDTYTLRGVANKLGYQRSSIEDAGSFDSYSKSFDQLGLSVRIGFSGSYVPEENIPAVLFDLGFDQIGKRSWNFTPLALSEVPPILLAESYADYLAIAEACGGFDPEWEKKTPW